MNIGPFYFESRDVLLLACAGLLGLATYFNWEVWMFSKTNLLTFVLLILIVRSITRSTDTDIFYYHILITLVLMLFLPFFQVLLFFLVGLGMMKILRVL